MPSVRSYWHDLVACVGPFPCSMMEAEFQGELRAVTVKMCYTWCASTGAFILFGTVLRLVHDLDPALTLTPLHYVTLLCHALCLVLLGALPLSLACLPACRRRVVPLVLMTFLLLCALSSAMVHLMVLLDAIEADQQFLPGVLQNASPQATVQVQEYLMIELGKKYLLVHMSMLFFFVSILQYIPYGCGTILVHVVVPVAIVAAAFVSPAIAPASRPFLVSTVAPIIFSFFHGAHTIALRRSDFRANYQLQDVLTKEAEALERARELEASQKTASQKADSILNHVLKNIMADASGCIDLFIAGDPHEGLSLLHQAIECLARGMRWCKKRQILLRIAAGSYVPCRMPVHLRTFGQQLAQGRAVACGLPEGTVLLDAVLCDVVLDNALNNALRHGHPTDPDVTLTVTMVPCPCPAASSPPRPCRLTFAITNRAHPARRPITPSLVACAMAGLGTGQTSSSLSDNLGLSHIQMAAEAHSMDVTLTQTGDIVTFEATVEAEVCVGPHAAQTAVPCTGRMPPGLRIFCLDDSAVARRLLAHFLTTSISGAKVTVLGATPEEVSKFASAAVHGADLVVLDQQLEYGSVSFHGTDLIEALLQQGFRGCICVRSANASLADHQDYLRSGAHCSIGKDLRPSEMVAQLTAAYLQFVCRRPLGRNPGTPSAFPAVLRPDASSSLDLSDFSSRCMVPGTVA